MPLLPLQFDPARAGIARQLLQELEMVPNRLLGQNFLINPGALDHIVSTAGVQETDSVLEIGSGLGALTVRLLASAERVTAIEKDARLATFLRDKAGNESLHLVADDALEVGWDELRLPQNEVKVVANLPYSVSKPLLRRIMEEWRPHLCSATVLVQREVANRLLAAPATSDYGPLSIMTQLYGRAHKAFEIAPGSFLPPPEVTSTVVHIEMLAEPAVTLRDERAFWRVVRAAFGQRRKMLGNTLKSVATRDALQHAFAVTDIDPQRRGETLSLAEFAHLSAMLQDSAPQGTVPDHDRDRA